MAEVHSGDRSAAPSVPALLDAATLRTSLADVRVLDVRWYLSPAQRGIDAYQRGHIPGAVFVDLEQEVTAPPGPDRPGRHPIPSAAQMTRAMRRAGVSAGTHVVVYDDAGGSVAARVRWLLRHYGHGRVSVLDGGIEAWTRIGGALETTAPAPGAGTFTALERGVLPVVDKSAVVGRAPGTLLIDARAPERYRGEVEPIDARPGHIPGARNAPWPTNLKDGRFLSPQELRRRYAELGAERASQVIVYCGSGVTACHDLLALELAGIPAALYEGSWSDWARDPALPAATGD